MEHCSECGLGLVQEIGMPNRLFTYKKGRRFVLPDDFLVPTCNNCGADFFDETLVKSAMQIIKDLYQLED